MTDFVTIPETLVPLSHLELEMDRPVEGWPTFLGARGIAIIPDDLNRNCISRQSARRLLDEKREDELRQAARRRVAEEEAVAEDQRRRSRIWGGVKVDQIPDGMSATEFMLASDPDRRPRRKSSVPSFIDGDDMVLHPIHEPLEDAL